MADKMIEIFGKLNQNTFEQVLPCYFRFVELSNEIAEKFVYNGDFIKYLVKNLGFLDGTYKHRHPNIIFIALQILMYLLPKHKNPREIFEEHNLYPTIVNILHEAKFEDLVVLEEIASCLLQVYSK